ncbi:MAG: hypothetical protein HFP78_00105 [Methylococcales symbiont of Hymedesmia sp. n. MRB-2018]|nr:MAG: hypothetical protein HFP78_00105 [Methylococcales symbiont of Hymedesmia sp. n. MRB-2018]
MLRLLVRGQNNTLIQPVLETLKTRFQKLGINDNILDKIIITADTGFADEADINAYIPDNKFRSRDQKFADQKQKQPRPSPAVSNLFKPKDFTFYANKKTCICPSGKSLNSHGLVTDKAQNISICFVGQLSQCRDCLLKQRCMRNPAATEGSSGKGRQVSFRLTKGNKPTHTDWMKKRVDSDKGKRIYGHRMSVVEPVFGNLEFNKNLKRFSLRGLKKVNIQWKLFCLIQNIEKLANYGKLPALS